MLFRDAEDCQHFLGLLAGYQDRFGLRVRGQSANAPYTSSLIGSVDGKTGNGRPG
jgi:hypothetical protein